MPVQYYILSASLDCPEFEPVQQLGGLWWGVAAVEDPEEQDRLEKLNVEPVDEEAYLNELKKKAGLPSSWETAKPIGLGPKAHKPLPPGVQAATRESSEPPRIPHTGEPAPAKQDSKKGQLRISDIGNPVPLKKKP